MSSGWAILCTFGHVSVLNLQNLIFLVLFFVLHNPYVLGLLTENIKTDRASWPNWFFRMFWFFGFLRFNTELLNRSASLEISLHFSQLSDTANSKATCYQIRCHCSSYSFSRTALLTAWTQHASSDPIHHGDLQIRRCAKVAPGECKSWRHYEHIISP